VGKQMTTKRLKEIILFFIDNHFHPC